MRVQITLELKSVCGAAILAQRPGFIDHRGPWVNLTPTVGHAIADISDSQDHFARQLALHRHIPCLDAAALQRSGTHVADADTRVNRNRPFADIGERDCRYATLKSSPALER